MKKNIKAKIQGKMVTLALYLSTALDNSINKSEIEHPS